MYFLFIIFNNDYECCNRIFFDLYGFILFASFFSDQIFHVFSLPCSAFYFIFYKSYNPKFHAVDK